MSATTQLDIGTLRAAITEKPPYCSGVCTLPADNFVLYYGRESIANRVNLATASDSDLELLSQKCQPATFGVNQKDILDESYRKAGKLDAADFSCKFNLERSGLMDIVHSALLDGHDERKIIKAELYKLNVYGKDSFFKAHKDTPRGEKMFASLVIFFPTLHDGGTLILRHGGKEWTFDSAKEVTTHPNPSIGFAAFYSDVEHEVLPVKSGYRVTLTYNLYFGNREPHISVAPVPSPLEVAFRTALSKLFDNPEFLPTGGNLGFGLRHEYPVNSKGSLRYLSNCLKGSDAVIKKVCTDLSLPCAIKVIYDLPKKRLDTKHINMMCDTVLDLSEYGQIETDVAELLASDYGARRVVSPDDRYHDEDTITVSWVTDLTAFTSVENSYLAYGNEATIGYLYGRVCLIVSVGALGNRGKL